MNIAFLAKRYDTVGGTERNLFELSRRLARRGHRITLYTPDIRRPAEPGVKLVALPRLAPGRTGTLWSFAWTGSRRAMRAGHDVVISFARALHQDIVRNGGGTHRLYLDKVAVAEPWWIRLGRALDPYHHSLLAIERRQYRAGHYVRIVANAPVVKQEIMDVYGVPDRDIQVIHNGVNTDLFSPAVRRFREAVRTRHGIPLDQPVVLFVGNGFRRKGLDALLAAAAPLTPRGLQVLVVGGDAATGDFERRARDLGFGSSIHFLGPQSRIEEYYGAADFFTLPSLYEPFGHSTLEALACGLPVIGAERTGASALLSPALAAFTLADPTDIAAFTQRLERLMDPATRAALRDEASGIGARFSLDANADAFEELCREVIRLKQAQGHP